MSLKLYEMRESQIMEKNETKRKSIYSDYASIIVDNERIVAERENAEKNASEKMKSLLHMNYEMLPHINSILSLTQKIKASNDINEIKLDTEKIDASSRHLLTHINNLIDQYFNNK